MIVTMAKQKETLIFKIWLIEKSPLNIRLMI